MSPATRKHSTKELKVLDSPPWAELPLEILGLIFQVLNLEEKLLKLSCVCKPWLRALKGPYCWKEIDIHQWSSKTSPRRVDRMLRTLIERSGNSFEKLCVYGLSSQDMFALIAHNAKNLQTLKLTFSKISDEDLEKLTSKLPSLTSLDIRQCGNIGSHGLEAVGKNCKNLTSLFCSSKIFPAQISDDMAHAIANTMPKLKRLDINRFTLGKKAAMEIITNCKELEELDITGCRVEEICEKYLVSFPNLKIVLPCDAFYDIDYCYFLDTISGRSANSGDEA